MKLKPALRSFAAACLVALALPLLAQNQPIKILLGFPAGGSVDITARVLADKMKDTLGVPVLVENRAGAGGRIAAQAVKDAAPDGNTLMLAPFAVMVVQPMVFKSIKYDTGKDFTALGSVVSFPLALAAGPATPAKNMRELVDWLRANPDKANYGSPAAGSMPHFLGELLAKNTNLTLTHVPFQGVRPWCKTCWAGRYLLPLTRQQNLPSSTGLASCACSPSQALNARPSFPRCQPSRSRALRSMPAPGLPCLGQPPWRRL